MATPDGSDSKAPAYRRAMSLLRQQAPDVHKRALVEHLRERKEAPSLMQRCLLIFERRWPEWRLPAFGLAFASVLSVIVGGALYMGLASSGIDAPEIDDIEFAGASAVVIESNSHPTTLIWLSDADAVEDEDEEEEEDVADEEEVEDL